MINRIFKTILVLTICFGLAIPTNAAVSVSDGSAFVTKAEFAADLNNLSNRMAQLENSLDAKIDSLVSSYLTRNGIWNGAKQELENYYVADFTNLKNVTIGSVTINNGYRGFVGKSGTYYPTNDTKLTIPSAVNSDFLPHESHVKNTTIIEKCNKSGLLYLTLNFACCSNFWGTDARSWFAFIGGQAVFLTNFGWYFDFFESDIRFANINMIYAPLHQEERGDSGIVLAYSAMQTKVLTFVSKDSPIICKTYWYFKRNDNRAQVNSIECGGNYDGVLMTVDDCVIY